jgi:hypothetical protein
MCIKQKGGLFEELNFGRDEGYVIRWDFSSGSQQEVFTIWWIALIAFLRIQALVWVKKSLTISREALDSKR